MKNSIIFFLLFYTGIANSGTVTAIGVAQSVTNASTGVSTAQVLFRKQSAANASTYLSKTVSIGKASLGAIIKRRAFSPYGAAIVVAMVAAGYLLDQATGEVIVPSVGDSTIGDCGGANGLVDINSFSGTLQACINKGYQAWPDALFKDISAQRVNYKRSSTNSSFAFWWTAPNGVDPNDVYNNVLSTNATDEQVFDSVQSSIDDFQMSTYISDDIANDSVQIPEVQVVQADLQLEQDLLDDADPLNDPLNPEESLTNEEFQQDQLNDLNLELSKQTDYLESIDSSLEVLENSPVSSQIDEQTDLDQVFDNVTFDLNDISNETLVSQPIIDVSDYIKGEGSCTPFVLDMGDYGQLSMVPFCSMYDGYLRDLMEWLLYGIMVVTIFSIWHDTVLRVES